VTKLTPLLNWQQKIGIYMLDVVPSLTQYELGSGTLKKKIGKVLFFSAYGSWFLSFHSISLTRQVLAGSCSKRI
jgi:hypothetical protein